MKTDYATLMDAVERQQEGYPASLPFDPSTAMMRFSQSSLFPCALGEIVYVLADDADLRAAVGTRYPGFVTPDVRDTDTRSLRDPLSMAIFVFFVRCHENLAPAPSMLRAIHVAIAEEMAAFLAGRAHTERSDGMIRIDERSGSFISRAGLVSGLAWLHETIIERDKALH